MAAPGCSVRRRSVKPTGIVDLMTTVAPGAWARASVVTFSTVEVSKKLVSVS